MTVYILMIAREQIFGGMLICRALWSGVATIQAMYFHHMHAVDLIS
jgi:hypothetical protein